MKSAKLKVARFLPIGNATDLATRAKDMDADQGVTPGPGGTYCRGYLGFAKMYLELLELLLELLLQLLLELLLELLLLLLLSWLPRAW